MNIVSHKMNDNLKKRWKGNREIESDRVREREIERGRDGGKERGSVFLIKLRMSLAEISYIIMAVSTHRNMIIIIK